VDQEEGKPGVEAFERRQKKDHVRGLEQKQDDRDFAKSWASRQTIRKRRVDPGSKRGGYNKNLLTSQRGN